MVRGAADKSAPLFTLIPVGEKPVSAAVMDLGEDAAV